MLSLVAKHSSRVYIAEYALKASLSQQVPHVLAARAQALFYQLKSAVQQMSTDANIRAAPAPDDIKDVLEPTGWKVLTEGVITPKPGVKDGIWEVWYTVQGDFEKNMVGEIGHMRAREVKMLLRELEKVLDNLKKEEMGVKGLGDVRTMDVWWSSLEKV
jgi:hypothetical protein